MYVRLSVINNSYIRSYYTEKSLNVIIILVFFIEADDIYFLDPLHCIWGHAV